MWSSMLEKNLVWNGGSKMDQLCGIVWTQNGGEICMNGSDMGIKIKMCVEWGVPLQRKSMFGNNFCKKVLDLCGMGVLSVTPFTENLCGITQHCVDWGVNPRWKSTQYWSFPIFFFFFWACYYAFWLRRPPGNLLSAQSANWEDNAMWS